MKSKIVVDREVLILAFRHAINRTSYTTQIVADNISYNISYLRMGDLNLLKREIETKSSFNSEIDKEIWQQLLQQIENEIEHKKQQESC